MSGKDNASGIGKKLIICSLAMMLLFPINSSAAEWHYGQPVQTTTLVEFNYGMPRVWYSPAEETDPCACPGPGNNWLIDMNQSCVTESNCDIADGNITFTGNGSWHVNATVAAYRMATPLLGQIIWMYSAGIITLG